MNVTPINNSNRYRKRKYSAPMLLSRNTKADEKFRSGRSDVKIIMYNFADFLVLCCLFTSGYFFGYYCKFTYIYDNLWSHWYATLGAGVTLVLAILWTLKKYRWKQHRFEHFYLIFYGLICLIKCGCFMLNENLDVAFYFGFIGLGTIAVPSYSFISLRSSSKGLRPARIALGNAFFFAGITIGFHLFNEFEPVHCAWLLLTLTLAVTLGVVINEVLQQTGVLNYKQSCDLAFNVMNDEKIVFSANRSVYALFLGRQEFYLTKNRQWLVAALSVVLVCERSCFFSSSYLQLTWSSTFAYLSTQYLYAPFLLYAVGCAVGALLMVRYQPKLIYLLFGLIKITATAAILGVYSEETTENSFFFIGFYYISFGVYSSVGLQMLLECTPFLYTELALAVAFTIEILGLEAFKYEMKVETTWFVLLGIGIGAISLTVVSIVIVQLLLPRSEGLIEIRNSLLGVRRHRPVVPQTKIWHINHFLQHDLQPYELANVKFEGNRMFQQYPKESEKKSLF